MPKPKVPAASGGARARQARQQAPVAADVPDISELQMLVRGCEVPREKEVKWLCEKAMELLSAEENIQSVELPVTVSSGKHVV